jgi:hypothetical protein
MIRMRFRFRRLVVATVLPLLAASWGLAAEGTRREVIDVGSLRGKVLCGYQGWFRCPGDASSLGWVHWSRDSRRLAPETLAFEMWPDLNEYTAAERFPAPGFTGPGNTPAELFSSDNAATVLRHFTWMRDYGIDGAWLQHFAVDLPGGRSPERYPSRLRVLNHVREAAQKTGRVWALSYDLADMPADRVVEVVTKDWKRLVAEGVVSDPRYLHQDGKPVVQVWGFYRNQPHNPMNPEIANRLIDFFKAPGRGQAFLVGGGDWNWRKNPDAKWHEFLGRLDAYSPWNVANYSKDGEGVKHASMSFWADDRRECEGRGVFWLPVVYPGFGWDNLQRKPAGATTIPRLGGRFLWEQFDVLARLGVDSAYVAMFDEVDEGTAIFKVTSTPPTQAHFLGCEGLPSDWYMRLVGEGARVLRGERPPTREIPIKP